MKKTLGRKILPLFVGAIFIFAFATSAGAIPLTTYKYTESGITYKLEITDPANAESPHTATFSISIDSTSDLRVGWVAFKFSPKGEEVNEILTAPDSNWQIGADDTPPLAWGGKGNKQGIEPFKGKWAGFYSDEVVSGKGGDGGLALTAGSTYKFDFTIVDPDILFTEEMPFKVGFYGPRTGNPHGRVITDQLSTELSVPEPATLLLVGSGLLLVGLWGRRKFKTVR